MADQIKIWRNKLLAQEKELKAVDKAASEGRGVVELDQSKVGRLSRMDAMQAQAMNNAVAARRKSQLLRIRAALQRLDEGEFGYCIRCGEEIAERRLDLDPSIGLCGTC